MVGVWALGSPREIFYYLARTWWFQHEREFPNYRKILQEYVFSSDICFGLKSWFKLMMSSVLTHAQSSRPSVFVRNPGFNMVVTSVQEWHILPQFLFSPRAAHGEVSRTWNICVIVQAMTPTETRMFRNSPNDSACAYDFFSRLLQTENNVKWLVPKNFEMNPFFTCSTRALHEVTSLGTSLQAA